MKTTTSFTNSVHRFGIISGTFIFLLMVSAPIVISSVYDCWPPLQRLIPSFISVALIMLPFCVAECIAYSPLIGPGGVYMAYVTGNTTSLKLPCALSALKIAEVEPGTEEGEAVSLVAVGTSALTATIVILIGICFAGVLSPMLSMPVLKPGLDNVLPALFGALCITSIWGKWKYFALPFIVSLVFVHFTGISQAYYMLIAIVISVIFGRITYSREKKSK